MIDTEVKARRSKTRDFELSTPSCGRIPGLMVLLVNPAKSHSRGYGRRSFVCRLVTQQPLLGTRCLKFHIPFMHFSQHKPTNISLLSVNHHEFTIRQVESTRISARVWDQSCRARIPRAQWQHREEKRGVITFWFFFVAFCGGSPIACSITNRDDRIRTHDNIQLAFSGTTRTFSNPWTAVSSGSTRLL